jgi:hypothetical protein
MCCLATTGGPQRRRIGFTSHRRSKFQIEVTRLAIAVSLGRALNAPAATRAIDGAFQRQGLCPATTKLASKILSHWSINKTPMNDITTVPTRRPRPCIASIPFARCHSYMASRRLPKPPSGTGILDVVRESPFGVFGACAAFVAGHHGSFV